MIKFSIIIPVRGVSDFLKESINGLKKIEYPNFEVIIVTDNSESYEFNDKRFFLLDSGGSGNPCLKRNLGAKKSTGEILVFLDDDAYPSSEWLTQAAKILEDPAVYALGGPAITPKNAGFLEKMSGRVLESVLASGGTRYRHIPQNAREIDDYPSVNLFVRKSAFDRVGGFILDFWPGEDTKLCLDLINVFGRNFLYSPLPVVYHHRRNLFSPYLKQVSRYGNHRGQFMRIFPKNSKPSVGYIVPPLFVLGLTAGPVVLYFMPQLSIIYFGALLIYFALLSLESFKVALLYRSVKAGFYVGFGIFLTHLVYGVNFIVGFIRRPKLKLKAVDKVSGNYTEG